MTWNLSPSGWPTWADPGSDMEFDLADRGYTVIDESDVQAAIAAFHAGLPPVLDDVVTVQELQSPSSPASVALRAASDAVAKAVAYPVANVNPPRRVTLVSGQEDDVYTVTTGTTKTADTTNFKVGTQGQKFTLTATTGDIRVEPIGPEAVLHHPPASAVMGWFYVADKSLITSITVTLYQQLTPSSVSWSRSIVQAELVNGWNFFNQEASSSTITMWGQLVRARIVVAGSVGAEVTIGHLWLECPPKAQILFIEDGGYTSFLDDGYPDLKALGVPVTWSIDPVKLGTGTGVAQRISEADVLTLGAENGNSIGYHGYTGDPTTAMTAAQLRTDAMQALRWLQARGFNPLWRSAFVQNAATNHAAIQSLHPLGYATPSSAAALTSFPFRDRYNIPRYQLHGRTTADLDSMFANLQATRQLFVCYTHAIDASASNMDPALWDYFVAKVRDGINAGWLEGVTFESLHAAAGTKFRRSLGDSSVQFHDKTGRDAQLAAFASAAETTYAQQRDLIPRAAGVVSLWAGQPDETITTTSCTVSADTVNKRFGVQSWKLSMTGAVTATATLRPLTTGAAMSEHVQAVGILCYIPDVTKINNLTFRLYPDLVTTTDYWTLNVSSLRGGLAGNLRNGWNLLRWLPYHATATGSPGTWGTFGALRLTVGTTDTTDVSVQQMFAEVSDKGRLLFIHDGGYSGFDTVGYPDLKARNIPVTWSVDCAYIGNINHVTEARLRQLAQENRNSISFHGWDDTTGASMDAAAAQAHTMRSIKWLAQRGFTGRIWRTAWLQNASPNGPATDPLVLANPMFGSDSAERINAWPFQDRYNVNRIQLHGASKTNASYDALFAELKQNRGVMVCYTHEVNGVSPDMTPAQWAYFLGKIDQGISEGWLEGTTLELLLASSGVPIRRGLGGALTVEWPNVDGTTERFFMP